MSKKHLRKKLFVDKKVQSGILGRLFVYFACGILFITLPLSFIYTLMDPSDLWINQVQKVFLNHWPIFAMMLFVLPFAIYDFLKFSNRFVGPIYRLRKELDRFQKTGTMKTVRFRDRDFWQDLGEGCTFMSEKIKQLEMELEEANNKLAAIESSKRHDKEANEGQKTNKNTNPIVMDSDVSNFDSTSPIGK